jgi:hypothetical protein
MRKNNARHNIIAKKETPKVLANSNLVITNQGCNFSHKNQYVPQTTEDFSHLVNNHGNLPLKLNLFWKGENLWNYLAKKLFGSRSIDFKFTIKNSILEIFLISKVQ